MSSSTLFPYTTLFRSVLQRAAADRVGDHVVDLRPRVAERLQRLRHGAVDDLEIAAAGELLELHQREVRLDAGDRKSTRLNSSHGYISYAVFCLKKKNK